MKTGRALTVVAEIEPDRRAELERVLAAFDLSRLPDTHFTRLVIVDDDRGELPALLVWESNHDGSRADYLRACAATLAPVFACCRGTPRHVRAEAFYCAYRGVSRAQVVHARAVRDAIRDYLDANRGELVGLAPVEIQARLAAHVHARGLADAPRGEGPLAPALRWAAVIAALVPIALLALVLLPVTAPVVLLGLGELRRRDAADARAAATRPVHDDARHQDAEDKVRQNQLTHLVDVKPGRLRLLALRGVLLGIDLLARTTEVNGRLGGITSIHFARWVLLRDPAGRRHRLLFFSNYDGSWDAYLGEFIDRAAGFLTAIWSHTDAFPRTARDEEAFKQWTRDHQIATQAWWSGVPDSTVENVRDDVWIREQLGRPLGDGELVTWLRRL